MTETPPFGTFTFIDACQSALEHCERYGLVLEVGDIFAWASQPRWATPDGRMMPLWYFAPQRAGRGFTKLPNGDGPHTTNHYSGGQHVKERVGAWIFAKIREGIRTGNPVMRAAV